MKPIYKPRGAAKEYGDLAINIYTGCPHRCFYCFAPSVLRKDREAFHALVEPRNSIVEETRKQIERENITGKLVHLCFTCDPYPKGIDSSATREIIKILKDSGNHVQILTKNGLDAERDFDLLDSDDWFGITYAGYKPLSWDCNYIPEEEPNSGAPFYRLEALRKAFDLGIKTWVSCEPVLDACAVLNLIEMADYVNMWKVGKLNYHHSDINWGEFGQSVYSALVEKKKRLAHVDFQLKDSLKNEMQTFLDLVE